MDITATAAAASSSPGVIEKKSDAMGKDDFLSLLITQLQNQDPLSPADSTEFTAQLAQFSSLEQMGNVNTNLENLLLYQASMNNMQAVSFIGKEVTSNGNAFELAGGQVDLEFELQADANLVAVSIYDQSGGFVRTFESQALAAGKQTLRWDGSDTNGNPAPDGKYTFELMAQDASKNTVNAITYSKGIVSGISFENNITYLQTGDRRIAVGDVVQVNSGTDAQAQN